LYTISWGWLFIVRDSYWADDWDLLRHTELGASITIDSLGAPPWLIVNDLAFEYFGAALFKFCIFLFYFCSSIFLFGILAKNSIFSISQKKCVSLLFLLLPFNSCRVMNITIGYAESYVLFFGAWYLLANFKSRWSRCVGFVWFFVSFQMFTMLVFFLLPVLHLFALGSGGKLRDVLSWARRNLVLVSLPFIYWTMRGFFWPPSRTYHEITGNKIEGFLKFVLLLAFVVGGLIGVTKFLDPIRKKLMSMVFCGLGGMFIGYSPYVFFGLVGYGFDVPRTYMVTMIGRSDWYSRHQILQPLGLSILLVGLIGLLPSLSHRFRDWVVGLILVISVLFNVAFGFEYVVDYDKQTSVLVALKSLQSKTASSDIQIIDQTTFLNARQRHYRERDWLGLVAEAEGIEVAKKLEVSGGCSANPKSRLVLIQGPETHWEALKNWMSDGDMGFEVTVDDTPGACKPEMVKNQQSSGAIPILFYFTGARG
jgi:hypothetical protein